jgi:DNA invertase Pin-like site-specific DNA recombinase
MQITPPLSPSGAKDKGEWPTPTRAVIRRMFRDSRSQREIVHDTKVPRRTVRRIIRQESSRRDRGKKHKRHHMMSIREIRRCIRHISFDWSTRRMSFERLRI